MKIQHVCVLVPARNEEKLLARCLNSILKAQVPSLVTLDIIVCVDASTDQTLRIAEEVLKRRGAIVKTNKANVGHARKLAATLALERYQGALKCCWMAHTDADCEVPTNWITEQLAYADRGAHGVTGIVKVDSYEEHGLEVPALFTQDYIIHLDGSHPHIHGANLGIRADAYVDIGGWLPIKTAEDHDLWQRLSKANYKLVSNAGILVTTSGRRQGRAPSGFAEKLASFNRHPPH